MVGHGLPLKSICTESGARLEAVVRELVLSLSRVGLRCTDHDHGGVRPDSEEEIKQAYPTTVQGLANLDFPGLYRFLAKSNEDKVSPPARGPR